MYAARLFRVLGLIVVLGLTLAVLATPAAAQTVYNWDATVAGGPNDGSGTWSLTGSNWWTGSSNVLWPNTSSYAAQFGSGSGGTTAYAVTLDPAGVTAGGVTFQNQAYTLTGTSTLTLGGATPTVTVNAGIGTIAAPIGGSSGLTKAGNGNLIFGAINTYTGPTIASAGTLQAGAFNATVSDFGFDNARANGGGNFGNNNNYRAIDYAGSAANTPWTPVNSSWTFQNHAGIVAGNGGWGVPAETSGSLCAGLQYYDSTIAMAYQTLSFPSSGTYTISFQSCFSNAGNGTPAPVFVYFNSSSGAGGTTLGSFIPASRTAWNPYSYSFAVPTAGNYEVAFEGYNAGNSNFISLIDSVALTTSTLPAGTALTVASGATLDLKAATPTVTTVSSISDATPGAGGTLTNSATGTVNLTIIPAGPSTFSGVIQNGSGTTALTLNGPGTQVLAGSNTYTGGTTITAGTLQVGNGGNSGTFGTGSVANNDTLVFNRSDSGLTVSSVISGSGAVYLKGSGLTTLTGINSFSGPATVSAGTLQIGNGTSGNDGSFAASSIVNNSTLKYNAAATQLYAGVISGSGALNKSGTGTLLLSGTNTYSGATTINGGTLRLAPGIAAVTPGSKLYLNAAAVGGIANGGTITAVQDLSGNGNNTTAGAGTVTYSTSGFNGSPTLMFNGASYLNDSFSVSSNTGTIFVVMKPNNLTQVSGALVGSSANGANVEFRQEVDSGAAQLGLLRQNTTHLLNSTTGGGAVTLSGQVVAVTYLQVPTGGEQFYVNGALQSDNGPNTGNLNGGASSCIGGASNNDDFNGSIAAVVAYNTVLTADQITATSTALNNQFFGTPANYAVLPSTTDLSISASGAGLDLSGVNQSVASLSGAAGSFVRLGGATLGVGSDGLTTTFAGNITDTGGASVNAGGALTKNGAGMFTLSGANNYSGATSISGGTLQIGGAGVLGGGNYTGTISNSGVLAVNTSSNQTYGGAISGAGPLYQLGSGTLTLAANNSYAGGTFINGGALVVGNGATAGSILSAGSNTISNNGVLASNRSDAVTWATTINGTGSVYQIGSGSLTLTGSNGYSGATTVAAGTLLLSNSSGNNIAASSPVTVNSAGTLNVNGLASGSGITLAGGQTLRGSGTVLGSVTVPSGATIQSGTGAATGTGIGTLTVANDLSVAMGANVAYYLGTPGTSLGSLGTGGLINVQGNLTLASSGLNLILNNNSGAGGLGFSGTGGFYELFSYSGSLSGFNALTTFNAPSGKTYQFFTPSNQIDLYVAINDLRWTGTASSSWDTNPATTNWSLVGLSSTAASAYQDGSNVTFSDTFPTSSGTLAVSNANVVVQAAGVQPNAIVFNNNALNYTLSNASGTAGIAGATGITLSGSGTVNLQSPNSFQGQVAINAGILNISNSAALGSSGGVLVASGGALQMQGNIALGAPLSLNGSGFAGSPAGALNSVSGTNSYSGAVSLSGPATIATNSGQLTLTGGINNGGNLLTIGGAGITTINTPGISGSGGLTVAIGATLNMNGSVPSTTNLVANGTVNFTAASQTLASLNDSGAGSGSVTLNNTALSLTGTSVYTGSISGGGSLTLPSGVLTLSGNSSLPTVNLNGATLNVTGGSVVAQTAFNAATGANTINLSGGVLQTPAWNGGANTSLNFNGGALQANASSTVFLGAMSSANIHVNAGGATIDTLANNISITQSLAGVGGLTKKGGGTLALNAVNSYGGPTLVSAGILKLGPAPAVVAGVVARYPFDNNTNDASGNGLNATLQNGPATFTAGQFSSALSLDGISQFTSVPYNAALALNAYTVSTWVNFNVQPVFGTGAGPALFSTRNGGDNTFDLQYYQPSAGVYALHADIGNGAGTWLNTAANYTLSGSLTGWNMVTLEASSAGYTYFLNGNQVSTGGFTTAGTPLFITSGETLSQGAQRAGGANYNSSSGFLNGYLDESSIYSGNLTPAQVLSLYRGQTGQLPSTSLVVNSGATFDLNGGSQQVTDLSGSGTVTNSAAFGATLTLNSTATGISTFSGTITNGAGPLSLLLTGTQGSGEFLSGVNTFTGSVTVTLNNSHYASLILANSGALLGPTLIDGNGLVFDKSVTSNAFTIGGLGGGGSLLTLANNGTGAAKHPVALSVGANNQNSTFTGVLANGTGLGAGGSLTKIGSGTLTLSGGANSYGGGTFINGGELAPDSFQSIPGLITFGGGALKFTVNNPNILVDYSGSIFNSTGPVAIDTNGIAINFANPLDSSNVGGFAKLGAGTLYFQTSNAYVGTTYIAGGTLNLGDPGAIPSGSNLTFLGGALQYSSSNTVDYSSAPYGIVNSSGPISIDTNGQNLTFAGVLDSSNSGGFTKLGLGTLILNASNAYGGTTRVAGGLLQLGIAAGIPANSPLNLTGGTLDVNGFSRSFSQSSSFAAGGTVTNYGSLASTISLSATSNNMTIASLLADGANPLAFSVSSLGGTSGYDFDFTNPNNTFSGGLNVSNASARLIGSNTNSAYAGTGTITISNSGFLMIWANTGAYAGSVTVSNNFVLNTIGGAQISSGGTGTKAAIFADGAAGGAQSTILTGSIDLASNGGVDAYNGGNPNSLFISGPIYGPGALVKGIDGTNGGGLVTLANTANSYGGGTVINTGTLAIIADAVLGAGNTITFAGNGTLQAASSLSSVSASRQIGLSAGTAGTGTLNSQNFTFPVAANISGTGALSIAGGTSGVVALSGNNTYGGSTFIRSGELGLYSTTAIPSGGTITFAGGALQHTASNTLDYSNQIKNSTGAIAIDTNSLNLTYGGVLDASNSGGLTKSGAGTLFLAGNNAYLGATNVNSGTLNLASAGAIPAGGAVTFRGGTLQYAAASIGNDYSSSIVNSTGPIAIDTNGLSASFSGALAGSNRGGLTKIGAER